MDRYIVVSLLRCWASWLGSDRFEIKKDVGYGINILAQLSPRKGGKKLTRSQLILYESGMTNLEINDLHNIIITELTLLQKKVIEYRYHKRMSVKRVMKQLHICKNRYYELHNKALDIILIKAIQKQIITTTTTDFSIEVTRSKYGSRIVNPGNGTNNLSNLDSELLNYG